MIDLGKVCQNLLTKCLGVKEKEELLIVCDTDKKDLAYPLYEAGKQLGAYPVFIMMEPRTKSGEEPPKAVSEAMKKADVAVCITTHSLTHTKARKEAALNGTRVATMPGVTEDMFRHGAITADYDQVKRLTDKVTDLLTNGSEVKIEKAGKVLVFSTRDRSGIPSSGVYVNPGESGNLPSGEGYIAPVEGTASGEIILDGSIADIGTLAEPVVLTIENGKLINAAGSAGSELLTLLGEQDGRLLCEFGIGTNEAARITGVVLEDEKVYGTIHIAFGSNHTFGGIINAGVHIDCVVKEPTVFIDNVKVMEHGNLLIK